MKLDTIDSLVMLWMDNRPTGLDATAVEVIPKLHPTGNLDSLIVLPDLKGVFREQAAPHMEDVERQYGPPNKPKLWLKDFKLPLSDRPTLRLTLGKTDYWTTKALELAFDSGVLRNEYERRRLNILEDLPGLTASLAIIITSDDHLILAQRKSGQVDFGGGMYSVSFDEQWDPLRDSNPYNTVLRGLSEEFNLDLDHGVHVSADNLKLFALAREWGRFWNTVLVYVVKLPARAEKVLECWDAWPPPQDKKEHSAVIAVPLSKRKGVVFLLNLLNRSARVSADLVREVCGEERIAGAPSDGELSSISGRARILVGLFANKYFEPRTARLTATMPN